MKSLKIWTEACWDGYKQLGMKKKGGRKVPNCVPEAEEDEFSMHTMWDKDGKPHDAKTKADHERMKKLGWSHENPRHNPYNPDEDVKEVSAMQRRARKAAYAKKTKKKYGDAAKMGIDAKDVNQRRNAPTRKKS